MIDSFERGISAIVMGIVLMVVWMVLVYLRYL
jgi:hypothetical protein